ARRVRSALREGVNESLAFGEATDAKAVVAAVAAISVKEQKERELLPSPYGRAARAARSPAFRVAPFNDGRSHARGRAGREQNRQPDHRSDPNGHRWSTFPAMTLLIIAALLAQAPWDVAKSVAGDAATKQLEGEINKRLLSEARKNQCSFKTDSDQFEKKC